MADRFFLAHEVFSFWIRWKVGSR